MPKDVLRDRVLVVNSGFAYVNIVTVKEAIRLLYVESAEVVTSDYAQYNFDAWVQYSEDNPEDVMIHGGKVAILPPRVIRLTEYHAIPTAKIRFSRLNVYKRDNYTCQYCATVYKRDSMKKINLDHVVPRSRGGRTTWENVVTSCVGCNTKKDDRLPSECNMFPINTPRKPTSLSLVEFIADRGPVRTEWKPFLSYLGI
jgi:hypothetical protein